LIPNVHTRGRRNTVGLLDGWVANDDVLSNFAVGSGGEDDNAIRVTDGGVPLDEIVVAGLKPDTEIGLRAR
jgi:hypothetical protein